MAAEQAKQFIEQAVQSLQGGQVYQALELADQAIVQDPASAEAYILSGVALSQCNQPQAASEAFESAIELDPGNAKAFYNYSVHLYALGKKAEALRMANHATVVDPAHAAAKDMVARIEVESGLRVEDQRPLDLPAARPLEFRSGYELIGGHALPIVERMGDAWSAISYGVIGLTLLNFVFIAVRLVEVYSTGAGMTGLLKALAGGLGSPFNIGLYLIGAAWLIMDLLDERGDFIWIVPHLLGGLLSGSWATLTLYLFTGRKKI